MTAANQFPWTLAADGKAARHERGAELKRFPSDFKSAGAHTVKDERIFVH